MTETRKTETRFKTSDPKKMLNMWTASRVLKTWTEDFVDGGTNEVVSIERNEVLFERATLIDQDTLAKILFSIEAGEISEVDISNQKRTAYIFENTHRRPFTAKVQIGSKKHNFLFLSSSVSTSIELLKDYIELNYYGGFEILMIKEFDTDKILTDSLTESKPDNLNNEDSTSDENQDDNKKKFYQIESIITLSRNGETHDEFTRTFVVLTFNIDRAMMIINDYLKKEQNNREKEAHEKGHEYEKWDIYASIESAKPIPVGCLIPDEFSIAYL